MPYCTRCGKKIEEGERCSCQKNVIDFDAALQNKNPVNQFSACGRAAGIQRFAMSAT